MPTRRRPGASQPGGSKARGSNAGARSKKTFSQPVRPIVASSDDDEDMTPLSPILKRPRNGPEVAVIKGKKVPEAGRRLAKKRNGAVESEEDVSTEEESELGTQVSQLEVGSTISMNALVDQTVSYLLFRQSKMTPFLRVELTREAMNGQRKDFPVVLKKVQKILKEIFLMELVGCEKSKTLSLGGFDSYILISRVPYVVLYGPAEQQNEPIRNYLYLILSMIYMGGTPLDADRLWALLCKFKFETSVCSEQENFEKFLKTEYVSKQYLLIREYTQSQVTNQKPTYEWGLRSHYEFSKMSMLKSAAEKLGVADIKSLSFAYGDAKKQIEMYGTVGEGCYEHYETDPEGSDDELNELRTNVAALDQMAQKRRKSSRNQTQSSDEDSDD